jgi:hypothetical protein
MDSSLLYVSLRAPGIGTGLGVLTFVEPSVGSNGRYVLSMMAPNPRKFEFLKWAIYGLGLAVHLGDLWVTPRFKALVDTLRTDGDTGVALRASQ